ncbi:protein of unknown function [Desulforamulus putei DSM 12395]|uniref:DUF3797 domain-containing protein n=1 Tax=Desulforamulus putei DSM 12395 TaxID=1121429 RepID=A0A1M5CN28_9FIRM|nr:protein of unknown function [Desulforamulus putei DSM 12395]
MNASAVFQLIPEYINCPKCGNDQIGNGEGKLIVSRDMFIRSCKCGFKITLDQNGKEINITKNLYRLNDDGVAEWVVAETKQQAFEFADEIWGGIGRDEYLKEFLEDNPGATFEDFIDYFVVEEDMERLHTFFKDNGDRETKTVREWLDEVTEVPSYFGCSDY